MDEKEQPQTEKKPFRREALEYITTPRALDTLIQITSPLSWVLLSAFWLILLIIILWTFLGRIETYVTGSGILLSGNQKIESIFAPQNGGYVKSVFVYMGEFVNENQVVAELDNPQLQKEIDSTKQYISELQGEYDNLIKESQAEIARRQATFNQQKTEIENTIRAGTKKIDELQKLVKEKEQSYAEGLIVQEDLSRTRVDYYAAAQDVQNLKKSLADIVIDEKAYEEQWITKLRDFKLKLEEQKNHLRTLMGQIAVVSTMKSPVAGAITSVQISPGDYLDKGATAFQIATKNTGLEAQVYVPAEDGKRVTNGMKALVSPSTVRTLEFGNAIGQVIAVDSLPATPESIQDKLKNKSLVDSFLKSGPVIRVRVKLLTNPKTISGLEWTSSKGPPYLISSGTLVEVKIQTRKQTPASLIIPILKKGLGY